MRLLHRGHRWDAALLRRWLKHRTLIGYEGFGVDVVPSDQDTASRFATIDRRGIGKMPAKFTFLYLPTKQQRRSAFYELRSVLNYLKDAA